MHSPDRQMGILLRDKYGSRLTPAAKRDIERLKRGEHLDYVIGWAEFVGLKIDLSARPLIPRPETEYWTEKVIAEMRSKLSAPRSPLRVLDLFCGSGCIGLAVLKKVPNSKVDFADVEAKYFPGIKKSARWNKIAPGRFKTIRSDILKNIRGRYDYILANPPYVPSSGRRVQKSVLAQEPHNALFAGKDGLRFIRPLIRGAKKHLRPGGIMVFEFDPLQKTQIGALARRLGHKVSFSRDQYGRWRYGQLKT